MPFAYTYQAAMKSAYVQLKSHRQGTLAAPVWCNGRFLPLNGAARLAKINNTAAKSLH
jgi:hypothetical protein